MPAKPGQTQLLVLGFPFGGVNEGGAFASQASQTAVRVRNMRTFEPGTDRARGGQRPGLTKITSGGTLGVGSVLHICHITSAIAPG